MSHKQNVYVKFDTIQKRPGKKTTATSLTSIKSGVPGRAAVACLSVLTCRSAVRLDLSQLDRTPWTGVVRGTSATE